MAEDDVDPVAKLASGRFRSLEMKYVSLTIPEKAGKDFVHAVAKEFGCIHFVDLQSGEEMADGDGVEAQLKLEQLTGN